MRFQQVVILFVAAMLAHGSKVVAQPVAKWGEDSHDFGIIDENAGPQHCTISFTNVGDQALQVVRVKSTCGCTVAQYPTMPLEPGEGGDINISFTPTGRPGPFSKDVYVYTNASASKQRLTVKGVVKGTPEAVDRYFPHAQGDLHFSQLMIANGEVKKGAVATATVTVYNSGTDTLVLGMDNNTSHINCNLVPRKIPPMYTSHIPLTFLSTHSPVWGINDDHVTITASTKDGTQVSSTRINIVTNVVQDFSQLSDSERSQAPVAQLSTSKLLLEGMKRPAATTATLEVRNTGKSPLIVRRATSSHHAIKCKVLNTLLYPGEATTIEVKVRPWHVDGNVLNADLTIITSDPSTPQSTVRVVGTVDDSSF